MSLTESERYYLARFIAEHHDTSVEEVTGFIEDPDVDSWRNYEFVSDPMRFDHKTLEGKFSPEFIEREEQLHTLTKAYCRDNPLYIEEYMELIQVTPQKETDLDLDMTNTWYEENQVPEIVEELETSVKWLQDNVYEEYIPEDYQYLYELNLALLLYGLDKSEIRISVDYMNGHHTLRSKPHTNGYISSDRYSTYARSIGMRLVSIFSDTEEIEDYESLTDDIVDELSAYYIGPIRQLVRKVEDCLTLHSEQEK